MLNDIFDPSRIKLDLESTTKDEVIEELIETFVAANTKLDRKMLLNAVARRESKMNTVIMPGIAVPHGYCSAVSGIIGAIGFSRAGIEYDDREGDPVHLVFLIIMDESSREKHLRVLGRLWELLNSRDFAEINGMETPRELYDLLCRY